MKTKLFFLTVFLFLINPQLSLHADNLISSVRHEPAPPTAPIVKQKKKKKRKQAFKKKRKQQYKIAQEEAVQKPGFIVMIIGGALLLAAGIAVTISSFGFGCGSSIILALGILLMFGGLVLVTLGTVFLAVYNSKKHLDKKRAETLNNIPTNKELRENLSDKELKRYGKLQKKITALKIAAKNYSRRKDPKAKYSLPRVRDKIKRLEQEALFYLK